MSDALFVLATVYRTLDGVVGSYLMAGLAPDRPMGHALVGSLIGVAMSTLGAVDTWNKDLGPRCIPSHSLSPRWGGKLRVTPPDRR
jgi:hypothetical protein